MPSFSSFSHLAQVLLLATVHRVAERRGCVAETSELYVVYSSVHEN
jgi:hypothetical protein